MEDKKETRGRKRIYNFPNTIGETVNIKLDDPKMANLIRNSLRYYAKRHGLKYRTWMVNDTKMVVECQSKDE